MSDPSDDNARNVTYLMALQLSDIAGALANLVLLRALDRGTVVTNPDGSPATPSSMEDQLYEKVTAILGRSTDISKMMTGG